MLYVAYDVYVRTHTPYVLFVRATAVHKLLSSGTAALAQQTNGRLSFGPCTLTHSSSSFSSSLFLPPTPSSSHALAAPYTCMRTTALTTYYTVLYYCTLL